jgi:hypothetical protein
VAQFMVLDGFAKKGLKIVLYAFFGYRYSLSLYHPEIQYDNIAHVYHDDSSCMVTRWLIGRMVKDNYKDSYY